MRSGIVRRLGAFLAAAVLFGSGLAIPRAAQAQNTPPLVSTAGAIIPGGSVTTPNLNGQSSCAIALVSTTAFALTETFEGTVDGSTWTSVAASNTAGGAGGTMTTSAGIYVVPSASLIAVRVRNSAYTSGAGVATILCSSGSSGGLLGGAAATVVPRLLTSASATACSSIFTGPAALYFIENANAASQTVTLTIYDEGASPTCTTADTRGTYVLGAGQTIQFGPLGKGFVNGLSYTLSGALLTGGPILLQANK